MAKYLSGRTKRVSQSNLSELRYRYLDVSQTEPNLGDPTLLDVEANLPSGPQYQIISVIGSPGERYWIPRGGGLIPGAITVYDEDVIIPNNSGISSITQLNFEGDAIRATGYINPDGTPGIGVTITVFSPGSEGQFIINDNDEFTGISTIFYDTSTQRIGIGTTVPTELLDVNGDIRLRKDIYDWDNQKGVPGYLIVKNADGFVWTAPEAVITAAGGTVGQVQFHGSTGLVDGADIFYYDDLNDRVGIGSTQPKYLLDVLGISSFKGTTYIDNLNVTNLGTFKNLTVNEQSTFKGNVDAEIGATINEVKIGIGDNNKITTFSNDLVLDGYTEIVSIPNTASVGFITAKTGYVGFLTALNLDFFNTYISYLNVTGVATINQAVVTNLDVSGITTTDFLKVEKVANFDNQANIKNLNVTGIATVDNLQLDGNTISSKSGNLNLNSFSGNIVTDEITQFKNTTESSNASTGSVIVSGGVGVSKNTNIGGNLNVQGEVELATNGGITTTGGDLYIGGDLYVLDDVIKDEFKARIGRITEHLEVKDLTVTGLSTFQGLVEVETGIVPDEDEGAYLGTQSLPFSQAYIGEIQIAPGDTDNKVTTTSGNLVLDSQGGLVDINDNVDISGTLDVTGATTLDSTLDVTGATTLDSTLDVTGATTLDSTLDVTGATTLDSTLDVTGNATFDGNVDLGNANTDTVTFTARVDSNIIPSGSRNLGSNSIRWNTVYANTLDGTLSVTTQNTTTGNLFVTGLSTFQGLVEVETGIVPDEDEGAYLGTQSLPFSQAYIGEVQIAPGTSDNTVTTTSGNLVLDSQGGLVDINDNVDISGTLDVDGATTLNSTLDVTGATTLDSTLDVTGNATFDGNVDLGNANTDTVIFKAKVGSNVIPTGTIDLGSSTSRWNTVYANTLDGTLSVTTQNTTTGNLFVTGLSTFQGLVEVETGIVPDEDEGAYLGTQLLPFSQAYIGEIQIAPGDTDNKVTTTSGNLVLDSEGGLIDINNNVDISGTLDVTGNATFDGNVDLGDADSDTVTFKGRVDSNIIPSGSRNLGSNSIRWNTVYANTLDGTINVVSQNINTGNLFVTGLSTFQGLMQVNTGIVPDADEGAYLGTSELPFSEAHIGNIQISPGNNNNRITTGSGDLTLDSNGNNINLGNNALVDKVTFKVSVDSNVIPSIDEGYDIGSSTLKWDQIYAREFIGQFIGNADTATKLATARDFTISGDGTAPAVSFDGTADVDLTLTLANTGVTAGTYGNNTGTSYPRFTVDSKGRLTFAGNQGIDFATATVAQSDKIKTITRSNNATHYLTFVTSDNSPADYESLYTDGGISYNPSTNSLSLNGSLTVGGLSKLNGNVDLGNANTDTVTFTARVDSNILPSTDNTRDLGSSGLKWNQVYATEFVGQFIGNADTATIADNLAGGAAGSIPYQSAANTTEFLAEPNVNERVLTYNNNTNAPQWSDLSTLDGAGYNIDVIQTGGTNADPAIRLSDGTNNDDITIVGGSNVNVTRNSNSQLTITAVAGAGLAPDTTIADIINVNLGTISADDAGADKIFFWDDSQGKATHLSVGTGLEINGTTLSANSDAGKTYTLEAVDSGSNAILRLSDGTNNDDVTITAGSNITINPVASGGFTISAASLGDLGGISGIEVQDSGVSKGTNITTLNFTGDISASASGNTATINVNIPTIPTNISDLNNDSGYIDDINISGSEGITVTEPTDNNFTISFDIGSLPTLP